MKKEEIIVDGQKLEVVIELPKELKDDKVLVEDLEDTLDLEQILETTRKIEVSGLNE